MRFARIHMALQSGAFSLPDQGQVVVFGPQAGDDLARMGFAPHARASDAPLCHLAVVRLHRSKSAARHVIAQAAARLHPSGQIVLDGQKTDGIASAMGDLQALGADLGQTISKAHGKLAVFTPPRDLKLWLDRPAQIPGGYTTCAGIFSADAPDAASQLLAAALPDDLPPRMADLGAGWGYLSQAILARPHVRHLDVIEADIAALDCAQINISDPRAAFHWADATQFRPAKPWDGVVMNPPFHTQRNPDPRLGLAFIRAAHAHLAPQGQIWLVANRHLPYMESLHALFRDVQELGHDPRFRLICAKHPLPAPKG
jgi:16S rRNA (guanine1207-N2)-methyltransferase